MTSQAATPATDWPPHDDRGVEPTDTDPPETREWTESLDAVIAHLGLDRARYLVERLVRHAQERRVALPAFGRTPYVNTVALADEPAYPGDVEVEERIERLLRWNAAVMVSQANKKYDGLGGHISTYASAATALEVAFNHFFQGKDEGGGRDQVFFQGHASPGIYARAWLEGRLTDDQLAHFRRESGAASGLSSYPHPWLMPDFWEFPTVSMGLAAISAIYQARFNRYLAGRGICDTSRSRVWAFLGDGEMDEPESTGALAIAAREGLDNLTFVINCNLQRLDGPVRGNFQVIQELEGLFRGAGWNVVKCIWSGEWDELLAADMDGKLLARIESRCDGEWQRYSTGDGAYFREHFFAADPDLLARVSSAADDHLARLARAGRGGHDRTKLYAAFARATSHSGGPSVVLIKTVKGYGLDGFAGRNATHQQKKLSVEDARGLRDALQLPISDKELEDPPLYKPADDAPEIRYLRARRTELGGPVPQRRVAARPLAVPSLASLERFLAGSGKREISTTAAFAQLIAHLVRDSEIGSRVVPIVPDEARTFGMEALFTSHGIYSPAGQRYTPPDADTMLAYKERPDGQVLEEGITEAGAMASFVAAGTSYATHAEPMIPFYVFYSMFGFQRIGDQIWAFGDMRGRGFLLGATAGRTTLNGEGLQHEDGHSLLHASTVPNVRAYDPAFAYEVSVIIQDGLDRMFAKGEDTFYYLTLYNENTVMPAMPEGTASGILDGLYRYRAAPAGPGPRVHLLGSGPILLQALAAQEILAERYGVRADAWSATSYTQLRREALATERWNRLHPASPPRVPYVTRVLKGAEGPVVASSDWMKSVNDMPARWIPNRFTALGTDGFGRSDTRDALRRHFEIDAESIVVATLHSLSQDGRVKPETVAQAIREYGIDPESVDPSEA